MSVGKLQEKFRCTMQNGCEIFAVKGQHFRSQRLISQPCNILPSAWSDLLEMAITPSFQLRIAHRLKHWIVDFLSFETTIACINWTSKRAPKVAEMNVIKNASWQISLCFPSLHSGFAYGKGL